MRLSSKEQKNLHTKKNKPYKGFSRFRTDLSLVGLTCALYVLFLIMIMLHGHPSTMYVNTPPPIASTIYSIFFFSATSKIPHIIQIDSKFTFMSTVPQANSISLCTISCLMSFGKQSSPPDVKSWTTFFTNKFEKSQKNKPYKVFSRFRTDLSLVGLNCFLYMILS